MACNESTTYGKKQSGISLATLAPTLGTLPGVVRVRPMRNPRAASASAGTFSSGARGANRCARGLS
jgi:hypothetical protein